jgi:hypothetical protein
MMEIEDIFLTPDTFCPGMVATRGSDDGPAEWAPPVVFRP